MNDDEYPDDLFADADDLFGSAGEPPMGVGEYGGVEEWAEPEEVVSPGFPAFGFGDWW